MMVLPKMGGVGEGGGGGRTPIIFIVACENEETKSQPCMLSNKRYPRYMFGTVGSFWRQSLFAFYPIIISIQLTLIHTTNATGLPICC